MSAVCPGMRSASRALAPANVGLGREGGRGGPNGAPSQANVNGGK